MAGSHGDHPDAVLPDRVSLQRSGPLPVGPLVVARDRSVGPIAVSRDHLVWEEGDPEARRGSTVFQREIKGGKVTRLAENAVPTFGLASTSDWVVYQTSQRTGSSGLAAVTHDGARRVVLTASVIAPIASRGEFVAWAEQDGERQRIVVRDMGSAKVWVAADMPRCERGRCYRIDAVELSDAGVVFVRGAVGPHPSVIVRRAFTAPEPEEVEVVGDPQPDLVSSEAGGLYFALLRGWYTWDFGDRRPHATRFSGSTPPQLVRYEAGSWLILARSGCQSRLERRSADGRSVELVTPAAVRAAARASEDVCIELSGLAWTGRQWLTAWSLIPPESQEEHIEAGLEGVLIASRALR